VWVWVPRHTTPLTHTNFFFRMFLGGELPGWCGHLNNPFPFPLIMLAACFNTPNGVISFSTVVDFSCFNHTSNVLTYWVRLPQVGFHKTSINLWELCSSMQRYSSSWRQVQLKERTQIVLKLLAWIMKGFCFVLCDTQWMQCTQHPTYRTQIGEAFQWEPGGWEAEACNTTRSSAQIIFRIVCCGPDRCHAQLLAVTIREIWLVRFSVEVVLPSLVQ